MAAECPCVCVKCDGTDGCCKGRLCAAPDWTAYRGGLPSARKGGWASAKKDGGPRAD